MPDYAVYGVNFYGTAVYGKPPSFDFTLDYFDATPKLFDFIKVEWGHPSGAWDIMQIRRGNYGFPVDENDGILLLEASNVDGSGVPLVSGLLADPGSFEDTNVTQLRFHYYSMFLRRTIDGGYVRAGNAIALMPKDYGYSDRLYELTPGIFRDDDQIFISSGSLTGMLETFLDVIGYECDNLRSELESLLWTSDPEKMSVGLLPLLAAELGFPYEAELGGRLVRQQLLNAVYLYKKKGTLPGVEGAISVLTGWAPVVVADTSTHINVTLLADRVNRVTNPSAETDASGWTGTNATVSRVTTQHLYGTAAFQMSATAGGDMSMITGSMPVDEGLTYAASMSSRPNTTARSVRVDILWFDATPAQIGSAVLGTAVGQTASSWAARPSVVATAPPGAVSAQMRVTVLAAGAGELHFWDGALFERAGSVADYFDGSLGDSSGDYPLSDYLWEGTVNLSRSHFYYRRSIVNSRLTVRLPDFLPVGFTFTALFAQPL